MIDLLIPVLFWLSIPLSLAFSIAGVSKKKPWMALLGAVLFLPVSYYFNGSPTSRGYMIFLPLFQAGSALAVWKGKMKWAWSLLLPAFLTVIWFAGVILYYQAL